MAGRISSTCLLVAFLAVSVVGTFGYGEVHEKLLGGIYDKKAAVVGHVYPEHHPYYPVKEEKKEEEKKPVVVVEPIKVKSVKLEPTVVTYPIEVKKEEEEEKEYYPHEHYVAEPVEPKTSLLKGLIAKVLGALHH